MFVLKSRVAILLIIVVCFMSCTTDNAPTPSGCGTVNLNLDINSHIICTSDTNLILENSPSINSFEISMRNSDGQYNHSWNSFSDFPQNELFRTDNYIITASYGDITNEGFDCPCFIGSSNFSVTDDEISAAILALMEQQKLVTEGAGATAVAAAMFNKVDIKGKKVVCLLSGGNIDVTILSRVIKRGLLMSGRTAQLTVELADKPGQLKNVSRIIADLGGNVTSVHHERANEGSDVTGCYLRIVMETRNFEHIAEIKKGLTDFGFKLV